MKVNALVKLLLGLDQESDVILQKDSEGNGYSPLSGAYDNAVYVKETDWSGNVYLFEWTAEAAGMTKSEWNKLKRKTNKRCVVLYPVN